MKNKLKYFFMTNSVVVIESDDWGYASLYNKDEFENIKNFITNFNSPYAYHSIEEEKDLETIYTTCSKIKDSFNQNLIITANFIIQQPDFKRIVQNNFNKLYFKDISIKKYKNLIDNKIFFPQFHGRHHFNIRNWEYDLKNDLNNTRFLCKNEVFVLIDYNLYRYNGENAEVTKKEIKFHNEKYLRYLIEEGLEIFEKIFGFKSQSVIAPSYYKNEICEKIYKENGIRYIQGDDFSHLSKKNEKLIDKKTYLGKQENNLISLTRNIIFEPSRWFFQDEKVRDYNKKILFLQTQIEILKGKPLVICSHSYNYLGSVNPKMRDFSLVRLREYIDYIKTLNKRTIFLNSVQLGDLLETGKIESLNIDINNMKVNYFKFFSNFIKYKIIKFKIIFYKILKRISK